MSFEEAVAAGRRFWQSNYSFRSWKSGGDSNLPLICTEANRVGGYEGAPALYKGPVTGIFIRKDADSNWSRCWEATTEEAREFWQRMEAEKTKERARSSPSHLAAWGEVLKPCENPF